MKKKKDVLTTSDVASICRVSTRIVTKWFDKQMLDGYRLPGSQHRRFTHENVRNFMERENMPIEWLNEAIKESNTAVKHASTDTKSQVVA